MNIKQLIVYNLICNNGDGWLSKSPAYLREKYIQIKASPKSPQFLLDETNLQKFNEYSIKWKIKI